MDALKYRYDTFFASKIVKTMHYPIIILLLISLTSIDAQNIANLEYYFDNDPGAGNRSVIAATANSGALTQNLAIPLTGLSSGFHKLTIRAIDDNGIWSLYHRETFYVIDENMNTPPSNLTAIEYWFNDDPGLGNGTELALSGTVSETIENFAIPLGDLEGGFHSLSIRIKNTDNVWSLYHQKPFYIVDPKTNTDASALTEAEFLYDAELGFGTGTEVAITPTGNPDEYFVEIPTDLVTCDLHDVSLSVKNALGNYALYQITKNTDVFDDAPPTIVVFPDIVVELDINGQAPAFTLADVDNGTFDDCALASVVLNQTEINYTCANLGANTVTVTATDAENKVSTRDVTVTVEDNISPVAIGQDIAIDLAGNDSVSILAEDVDNGSSDNCDTVTLSVDVDTFTAIGVYPVVLTITDSSGNITNTNVTVTVSDTLSAEAFNRDSFELFPNPTKHNVQINFNTFSAYDMQVYDVSGKKVFQHKSLERKNTLDFSKFSKGVYFLKIKEADTQKVINVKVIKQ